MQVRLQLEALFVEKSRLAQENANLTRENQSLMQLVEYHQLTSQDLKKASSMRRSVDIELFRTWSMLCVHQHSK